MPAKKKKDMTWDEIGKAIGKKMEKCSSQDCNTWKKQMNVCKGDDGFFGRLLFIIGLLVALNYMGVIGTLPWWVYLLLVAGFSLMKF